MTVGLELGKQLPISKHAASEPCVHVHMCNYVHISKAVLPALLALCVNELLWKLMDCGTSAFPAEVWKVYTSLQVCGRKGQMFPEAHRHS